MFYAYGYDKGSKVSRLAQWKQVEKSTGYKPESLHDRPVLRESLAYLWNDYLCIKAGCDDVTYQDLEAYQNTTGAVLSAWEVSTIIDLDLLRRKTK